MFSHRFIRVLAASALLFTVSACATSDEQSGNISDEVILGDREGITAGPLQDSEYFSNDFGTGTGPTPGTQADLVVNVGDRVFFGYDRYDLTDEARQTLNQQAMWMKQYPAVSVTIEGHADERGTREYNLALGDRRANAAKNYLVAMGIDPRRISTISYGKERPAVPGSNATAWAQNRRGVTKVN